MGSFISLPLPLLSFLALPLYSSPGTSVNLLLFTVNWYILLLAHPPQTVELYGITVVRLLCYLFPALLFLGFDNLLPTAAEQIKAQGPLALPTRNSRQRQGHIVFWSVANLALGIVLHSAVEFLFTKVLSLPSVLSLSKTMPLPYSMIKTVGLLITIRGVSSYLNYKLSQSNSVHRRCNTSYTAMRCTRTIHPSPSST